MTLVTRSRNAAGDGSARAGFQRRCRWRPEWRVGFHADQGDLPWERRPGKAGPRIRTCRYAMSAPCPGQPCEQVYDNHRRPIRSFVDAPFRFGRPGRGFAAPEMAFTSRQDFPTRSHWMSRTLSRPWLCDYRDALKLPFLLLLTGVGPPLRQRPMKY